MDANKRKEIQEMAARIARFRTKRNMDHEGGKVITWQDICTEWMMAGMKVNKTR